MPDRGRVQGGRRGKRPGIHQKGVGRIRIRSVRLVNYRRFKDASVELGDGVIGILGQNGTGKSSLVEAIAWAIYGNEPGILRNGKEGVKRSGALPNEECLVAVDFDLEGDVYRLVRTIKGKNSTSDATLLVNEKMLAKGDRAVTEAMVKRLGMDHKAFFTSVFARQKELNSLSALRPAERKKLILRMLGVDVLDEVVDSISKDSNSLRSTLDVLRSVLINEEGKERVAALREERDSLAQRQGKVKEGLAISSEVLALLDAEVAKAKERIERSEARSSRHRALEGEKVSLVSDIRNMTARRQRIASDMSSLEEKAKALALLGEVETDLFALERRKEYLDDMKARHSQLLSLNQMVNVKNEILPGLRIEVDGAVKDIQTLGDPEQMIMTYDEVIDTYRATESGHREESNWCTGEIMRLKKEMGEKEAKANDIRTLGPESACPTCERKLEQQYSFLLAKVGKEAEEILRSIDALKERKAKADEAGRKAAERRGLFEDKRREAVKAKDRRGELQKKVSMAKAAMVSAENDIARAAKQIALLGTVEYDVADHEEVRKRMSELRPKVDQAIRLKADLQRRAALEGEGKDIDARLRASNERLAAIIGELESLGFAPEELVEGRKAYSKARDDKDEELRKISALKEEASGIEAGMDSARARISDLEAESRRADELRMRQMELNVLLGVMKEFRSNVMSRVVPTLSRTSSELFTELTEGRFGGMDLDDDYEVHIFDGGERYPLSRFSGGESDLANLSLRLAISGMIAERSGRHVDLLVLDEIFGSQDNVRKRNIMNLLSTLQRRFSQIMVITHIDDIKDAVDDLIMVSETNDGCSRIGRAE
ncbi:MAG: SMC family ATPase [Methanomassiliicoccales archaeon]|jgi:exonuclease SbcC